MFPVIEVKNLTFFYPGRENPVLQNINFSINEGEVVLIYGETGCGKTTLLNCLNGLIPHESNGLLLGEVRLFGNRLDMRPAELFPKVATVFQNPATQIISGTVAQEIAFGLENIGLPQKEIRRRVAEALEMVGLNKLSERSTRELSGGEKQRLAIGAALAAHPKILLLDEPLSHLDSRGVQEVLGVLKRLIQEKKLTIVLVEHRIKEVLFLVQKIIKLKNGQIIYYGEKEAFPYNETWKKYRLYPEVEYGEPMIKVSNLKFSYNGRTVLNDINFLLRKGERVAILGQNGSGKSTLLSLLAGILKPKSGKIHYLFNVSAKRLPCALLLQDPDLMLFRPSVAEELSFAPKMLGLSQKEIDSRIQKIAKVLGLSLYLSYPPFGLSRGERLRVALGSILSGNPEVLLLDEPTTGQDKSNIEALFSTINADLVVFSTHDYEVANAFATRILKISNGRIIEDVKTS